MAQATDEHLYDDGHGGIWVHPWNEDTCPMPECSENRETEPKQTA